MAERVAGNVRHSRRVFNQDGVASDDRRVDLRVLVCGGRAFADAARLTRALDSLHASLKFLTLIEGGALGADSLAREWAQSAGIRIEEYAADWLAYGRAAGPIRNKQMLDEGRPDLIVAFPGGRGTANMTLQARQAGVRVIEIPA